MGPRNSALLGHAASSSQITYREDETGTWAEDPAIPTGGYRTAPMTTTACLRPIAPERRRLRVASTTVGNTTVHDLTPGR